MKKKLIVEIKPFDSSFAKDCSELIKVSMEATYEPFYFREHVDGLLGDYSAEVLIAKAKDRTTVVAVIDHEVVGVGSLKDNRIKGVYVKPSYFGCGVGRRLLTHLEEVAVANGFRTLELFASLNAEQFYLRQGYQLVAKVSDENGPALSMRKEV